MPPELILLPMGALAALTFIVLSLIPFHRFRAAFAGQVTPADFRYGESERVPGPVSIPNRNYMNLLEMPMLFYVAAILYFVTSQVDVPALVLAWAYVALRAVHSFVHLTYNNIMHRLAMFATSNFVLVALWAWFFWKMFG
jgi:hypothetical protein